MKEINHHNPATCFASAIGTMREAAHKLGYALGLHGSMQRDMDIIAVPWIEGAAPEQELVKAIAETVGGFIVDETNSARPGPDGGFIRFDPASRVKPHGRMAWTIIIGGRPFIDLSVMPRVST